MNSRWDRLAAASGVLFVVLVAAGAVTEGGTPGSSATGPAVIAFYRAHAGSERIAPVLLALGFAALVFYGATLRSWLTRRGQAGPAAALLAGATLFAAGETLSAGLTWTLADQPARLEPAAAQALNLAANDLVLVSAAGWFVLAVAAGLAILRGAGLPVWLGWTSLLIAVLAVTPLEFVAFLLLLAWSLVTGVLLWTRWDAVTPDASLPQPVGASADLQ